MVEKHCWQDKRAYMEEHYGYGSPEHDATYDGNNGTCLLPRYHEGPHVWTPDNDIQITWKGADDA